MGLFVLLGEGQFAEVGGEVLDVSLGQGAPGSVPYKVNDILVFVAARFSRQYFPNVGWPPGVTPDFGPDDLVCHIEWFFDFT